MAQQKKGFYRIIPVLIFSLVALHFFAPAGWTKEADRQKVSIVINGSALGGTWYVMAGAIASVINKHVPWIRATSQGGAAVENVHFVGRKETEFGFTLMDTAYFGYKGGREFAKNYKHLRAVMAGQVLINHVMVQKKSSVHGYEDLSGKRLALGSPGGGTGVMAQALLAEYGLKGKYREFWLTHPEGAAALRDGVVDVQFNVTSPGAPVVVELTSAIDIRFIHAGAKQLEAVLKANPYWFSATIPAQTYRGQDQAASELASSAIIVTHAEVPNDVVYEFAKTWFTYHDELVAVHKIANQWKLNAATQGVIIPLHPGAVRFYQEKNIKIPPTAH